MRQRKWPWGSNYLHKWDFSLGFKIYNKCFNLIKSFCWNIELLGFFWFWPIKKSVSVKLVVKQMRIQPKSNLQVVTSPVLFPTWKKLRSAKYLFQGYLKSKHSKPKTNFRSFGRGWGRENRKGNKGDLILRGLQQKLWVFPLISLMISATCRAYLPLLDHPWDSSTGVLFFFCFHEPPLLGESRSGPVLSLCCIRIKAVDLASLTEFCDNWKGKEEQANGKGTWVNASLGVRVGLTASSWGGVRTCLRAGSLPQTFQAPTPVFTLSTGQHFPTPSDSKLLSIKPGQYFSLCFTSLGRLRLEARCAATGRAASTLERWQNGLGVFLRFSGIIMQTRFFQSVSQTFAFFFFFGN